jgi:hypothetical protein
MMKRIVRLSLEASWARRRQCLDRRTFQQSGRLEPFLTAGAGVAILTGGLEAETKAAGNFGIGMDVRLTDKWALRSEQRMVISGAPRGISAARGGAILHFVPSAGFVFRF